MKTIIFTLVAGFLILSGLVAKAATITWTNTVSGNWNVAANWNPNTVPSTNDTAVITNAGVTVFLNINPTVGGIILGTNGVGPVTLSLNGETLTLDGPLTVNPSGSFTVDNGDLFGNTNGNAVLHGTIGWSGSTLSGILTLASDGTINITTANDHSFPNCTLTNYGTVTWASGRLQAASTGTFIYNYGLWDAQSDQTLNDAYGGKAVFNNYGTFRKSGGGPLANNPTSTFYTLFSSGVTFNQLGGVIDVQNSTNGLKLVFQGGGNFTGGYITTNGMSLTVLSEGNFTIDGTVTTTNTWEDAGELVGTNVIQGGLTWVGGDWNSGPHVTVASNSTVIVAGGTGNNNMANSMLTNYGTVTWASGTIQGGSTLIYNYGLWDAQSDQTLKDAFGGTTSFNNYGTFRKSGGGPLGNNPNSTFYTLFSSGVAFNQLGGVIDVQNSTNGLKLVFQGGGNFIGGYITTNGMSLTVLSEGNFTVNGTITTTNTWEDTGNLVGTNVIQGGLTWVGGDWNSAPQVTIASNSTVIVAGGTGDNNIDNCTVTNYGTVTWASGTIQGGGSGTFIDNYGLWDAQSDQTLRDAFGGTTSFNNYGTFRKSASNGNPTTVQSGVAFQNDGTVDARNGEIQFSGSFANSAGTLSVANGATIQMAQAVVLPNGLVTGSGTVQAPTITSSAVISPGATNAILTVAGNYIQQLGGSMEFDLGGTMPGVNQSQVNVTGTAKLSGLVGLRFSPGYTPALGSSNMVLTAKSVSGHFNFQDHFLLLGQNRRMSASYNPTNVTLTAISAADPTGPTLIVAAQNQVFAADWPSEFAGYNLYVKTNLTDPSWTLVLTTNGFYAESPITSPHKFFTLGQPPY